MLGPFTGSGIQIREKSESPKVMRSYHYWEFVVYLVKLLLVVTMVVYEKENRLQ